MKQHFIYKYLILFFVCFYGNISFGQAPANNDCAGAFTVAVNSSNTCVVTRTATTINATQSQAGCTGTADDDVWFSFVATSSTHTVTASPGTITDIVLQVFGGSSCGSLGSSLACEDGPTASNPEVATLSGLTSGNTYYFRVHSYGSTVGTRGTFSVCVTSPPPPPANDNCSGSFTVPVNAAGASCVTTSTATSVNATQSQAACTGTADDDVWFNFTATATTHTITVTPGTMSDVVLQVFNNGACGSLTSYTCADGTGTTNPEVANLSGLTIGSSYYVRVHSFGNGSGSGTFTICITTPPTPPANDNCSGAFTVAVNSSTNCVTTSTATSVNATQSQAGCAGTADDDVWFSFTATSTTHSVTVTPGTMSNVVLQAFSGTCGSLNDLGCTNATTGSAAEIDFLTGLTPGTIYYFRVHSSGSGSGAGTFTVCVTTPPPPPANDDCSGAFTVAVNAAGASCVVTSTATSVNATQSQAACSGSGADDDVWFSFTATATTHTITVTPGTMSDVVLQTFTGACGSLTSYTCADGTGTTNPEKANLSGLTIGTVYYFRVHSFLAVSGTFTVCITTPPPPPANDNCSGAYTVAVNAAGAGCVVTTTATSTNATQSQAACTGSGADDDVWFSFTATTTTHTISVTPGTLNDVVIQVFNGACGSLTSNQCVDANGGSSTEAVNLSGLTAGNVYYFRVFSLSSSAANAGTFTVCITTPLPPPANDNCSGAYTVAVNAAGAGCVVTRTATSVSATQSQSACGSGNADDDVWFSFTATATSHTVTATPGTIYDIVLQAFSGSCGSLSSFGCVDGVTAANPESAYLTGLTIGTVYYFRVFSYDDASDAGTFTVCVTSPPPPPANDNCPGATSAAVSPGTSCTTLTNGTLLGATASSQANGCAAGNDDNDVWYSFVATSNSHSITINNVNGSETDLYHSVYAGTCASLGAAIVCSDPNNSTVNGLTVGNTYYIRIYTYYSAPGATTTFSLCIKTTPPTGPCGNQATNDFCSNPATLTQGPGTFSSSTSGIYSSDQAINLDGIFCGSIENNSWYQFVATSTSHTFPFTSITNCVWGDGVQAHVYNVTKNGSGCCTGFTSKSNCYNPGTTSTGTVTATGLTIGQTYVLMVDGYAGDVCDFTVSGWTAVGILPLELMTFVGHNEDEKNKIEWVTASEHHTNYFTIERSKDGSEFEKLMDVTAAGNSSSPKNYNIFDLNPYEEITYYRLKLVDQDNSYEYSNIIAIDNKNLTDYMSNARPNPTKGDLEFDVNMKAKGKVLVEIYNNTGNLISSEESILESGYRSLNIDLNKYDSGIYLLKVSFENSGKSEIQKIIKN